MRESYAGHVRVIHQMNENELIMEFNVRVVCGLCAGHVRVIYQMNSIM